METKLCDGIDWVGYVDWNVRDFHGYETDQGSTYNAYLIRDQKTALIDTVKEPYAPALLARVAALVGLEKIDYIVCNHAEPDHSGSLPVVMAACPQAELVCDAKCRAALAQYYAIQAWKIRLVKDGDTLALGRRTLKFFETPMSHWPESMATYVPEEQLLFSMDAFGQHLATAARFDDQVALDLVLREAKTYYANILMLYAQPNRKLVERLAPVPIKMIAPSHGVIWRKNIPAIVDRYRAWAAGVVAPRALIVYDTMWKSTEIMAAAIQAGVEPTGADFSLHAIRASNPTVLATELLDAAAVAFGSPTLNQTLMPQAAAVLAYWRGLKPLNKTGFAFGSYGWGKGGADDVHQALVDMKFEILRPALKCQYRPTAAVLDECRAAGRQLGAAALARAKAAAGMPG